jgi:glycosyltransferase involved in cell wall biosynthesis
VVSTRIGAEGLARKDGEFCALADHPEEFARQVVEILSHPQQARDMTERARGEVETNWDMPVLTKRLEKSYREVLREKRRAICQPGPA